MKKIIYLLIASVIFASCEDTESPLFTGDRTLVYFEKSSVSLDVVIDETGSVDIPVTMTTLQDEDVTVDVKVVKDDTTADEENYKLEGSDDNVNTTATIPAGEYTGSFTINGIDNSVETTPELITFEITDADGRVFEETLVEVSIKQVCPINEDNLFVGDYLLEQVSPQTFSQGPVFNTQVVTLFNNNEDEDKEVVNTTKRAFEAVYLEAAGFGNPTMTVGFDLVCNNVIVDEPQFDNGDVNVNQQSTIVCDPDTAEFGIALGPLENITGNYDDLDDSSFTLIVADLYEGTGGCSSSNIETEFLLTKVEE